MKKDGRAVMSGGPEDGMTVYVGERPPRTIDFEEAGRVARYVRCTRLPLAPFRCGGAGHLGQTTYRFTGYTHA